VVCRLLQRGSMFVFSQSQFQQMLGIEADWTTETLLDLGNILPAIFFISLFTNKYDSRKKQEKQTKKKLNQDQVSTQRLFKGIFFITTRPLGRPYTSWMAALKNNLSLHNLTFEDAIELALDKSLWRLLVASRATH